MVDFDKESKTDCIRELLLRTVGKNPDLFSYYVTIQEAKKLLDRSVSDPCTVNERRPLRKVAEG